MLRSAVGVMLVTSVALLLAGVGSVTPTGAAMVAVLLRAPAPDTVPLAMNVTDAPAGRFTVVLMFPAPLAAQLAPAVALQVQVTPPSAAGKLSTTVAPTTAVGPLLVATIVYVTVAASLTLATPSVLVMLRSAVGVTGVLMVTLLLPATGSAVELVTVAEFTTGAGVV